MKTNDKFKIDELSYLIDLSLSTFKQTPIKFEHSMLMTYLKQNNADMYNMKLKNMVSTMELLDFTFEANAKVEENLIDTTGSLMLTGNTITMHKLYKKELTSNNGMKWSVDTEINDEKALINLESHQSLLISDNEFAFMSKSSNQAVISNLDFSWTKSNKVECHFLLKYKDSTVSELTVATLTDGYSLKVMIFHVKI